MYRRVTCITSFVILVPGVLREKLGALDGVHLVMAGGYDTRVTENQQYYKELYLMAEKMGLLDNVTFVRSFSDSEKRTLLHHSTCLLYTPDREHFGIVPIEAMYMRCPVIAVKSGGPLETVSDKKTGFLCAPTPERFAEAMEEIVNNPTKTTKLGEEGHERVITSFSFVSFTSQLNAVIDRILAE